MTSKTTPAQGYFDEHVAPALSEWRGKPTSIRLAKAAAVALYHLADHYWGTYSQSDPRRVFGTDSATAFRVQLAKRFPDHAILRDVAESHKHMKLNRANRIVTDADQTKPGSTAYGEGPYGEGPFGGGPSIIVEFDDGSKRHLSAILSGVEAYWKSELT